LTFFIFPISEVEWDGAADEAKLIEASHEAAKSCLFIRKKI
jgi:hypothetical protein